MGFNELNSVEHYIIYQLSGMHLNTKSFEEPRSGYGNALQWVFRTAEELDRGVNEVLVEAELKNALIKLNPAIAAQHELADEVIYKLRAIPISVNQTGLVRANFKI